MEEEQKPQNSEPQEEIEKEEPEKETENDNEPQNETDKENSSQENSDSDSGSDEGDSDSSGSYEEEEEESDDIVLDEDITYQAHVSAATHSARAVIQVGTLKNYVASLTQADIVANGAKHPWEIINPAGVHPKDKKHSIFHYKLSALPDTVEAKPWTAPGADITDWFNYGFNEQTWEEYREKMLAVIENQESNMVIKSLSSDVKRF